MGGTVPFQGTDRRLQFSESASEYTHAQHSEGYLLLSGPDSFAIMLSEVRHVALKRFVQTVSYLPHFISWVVVTGIAYAFFSTGYGIFNELLLSLGVINHPIDVLTNPDSFYGLAVSTAIWKEAGWWTIIFLAAVAGIDPSLYEAAQIDGAGRLTFIVHYAPRSEERKHRCSYPVYWQHTGRRAGRFEL